MARTPVNWDPKRYGSVKHILKFDASTGTYSLQEQEHNYTGVNYNFSSLPSSSTTTSQTQTGTGQSQTGTTSAQTTQAFGNVQPQFAQHDNEDPFSASFSKDKTMTDANTVMGFKVDEDNKARGEMTDANVGHEAFDKSRSDYEIAQLKDAQKKYREFQTSPYNISSSDTPVGARQRAYEAGLNETIMSAKEKYGADTQYKDRFETKYDQGYKDEWIKDTESNPRGSTYSGFILKSEADRIKREREAKLDKMSKIPFIGSSLVKGSEFIRNITPREWRSTDTQKFNKQHFTAYTSGSMAGRITGDDGNYDPANNLYHGMNRVSMYGNLEQAGQKRIDRINKTLSKWEANPTKYADKLKNTTLYDRRDKFEKQQNDYVREKHKSVAKAAVKKGADPNNPAEMHAASKKASNEKGNSGNGGGNTRVICTELHRTGEMSTVDWVRDTRFTFKTLTKSHVKGYLFWAIPTVRHMKKYLLYRKIWKHIAQHRANDIAWRLGESKFDLLGRIYAGIGEPTCWLIGKFVSDKQYNELNLKNWRKA